MAKIAISRYGYGIGTGGYTNIPRMPAYTTENRIHMPQVPKRPLRFQARTLIRHELLRVDAYWYTLHRRGPKRLKVGEDPLEARAVPKGYVKGTLPERIFYKTLLQELHMIPWSDVIFQSSLQGGRMNMGGIVADFVFPIMMIVVQVDGPTHKTFLRGQKDDEQDLILNEMGYQVYHLLEETIYNEGAYDDWIERTFGWMHSGGSDSQGDYEGTTTSDGFSTDKLYASVLQLQEMLP